MSKFFCLLLSAVSLCLGTCLQAQAYNFEVELVHGSDQERRTKEQLQQILSKYEVQPWIVTREVRIDSTSIGKSQPVLTLSTQHVNNDLGLLAELIHEQIHWRLLKDDASRWKDAMSDLKSLYPQAPVGLPQAGETDHVTYLHLIVLWLELDAMTELTGRERARQLFKEKGHYTWICDRVLEDTFAIGRVLARHGLIITPCKGLVIGCDDPE